MGHTTPIDKLAYHQSIIHKQAHHHLSKELLTNLVLHSKWDVTILLIQNKNSLCNLPELGYKNICSPWLQLFPICDCFLERNGLFYIKLLRIHMDHIIQLSSQLVFQLCFQRSLSFGSCTYP